MDMCDGVPIKPQPTSQCDHPTAEHSRYIAPKILPCLVSVCKPVDIPGLLVSVMDQRPWVRKDKNGKFTKPTPTLLQPVVTRKTSQVHRR